MRVHLRDHKLGTSGWKNAVTTHFPNNCSVENDEYGLDDALAALYNDSVVFLHPEKSTTAARWAEKLVRSSNAHLLLIGTDGFEGSVPESTLTHVFEHPALVFEKAEEPGILEFVLSVRDGQPDWSALEPRVVLSALSILCQGYLAVYGAKQLAAGDKTTANAAWSRIGLQDPDAFESATRALLTEIGSAHNWEKVSHVGWWLAVFDRQHDRPPIDILAEELKREWRNPTNDVSNLLDELRTRGADPITDNVVIDAFDSITARLEGRA